MVDFARVRTEKPRSPFGGRACGRCTHRCFAVLNAACR
jgi:hypothetical protein